MSRDKLSGCYNMLWTWTASHRPAAADLLAWQRVNHFGGIGALTRKDLLKRHIERARAVFGSSLFDFLPQTYLLPKEYAAFVEEFSGLSDDEGEGNVESPTTGERRTDIWRAMPPASGLPPPQPTRPGHINLYS